MGGMERMPVADYAKTLILPLHWKRIVFCSLGIFIWVCTFQFCFSLSMLADAWITAKLPHILLIVLVVIISGCGIELGQYFLLPRRTPAHFFCKAALFFSLLLLVTQIFSTIMPGTATCGCLTFTETIMAVQNWNGVELSGMLFLVCLTLHISKFNVSKKVEVLSA